MLELNIDELLLDGFSSQQGETIRETVNSELQKLLQARDLTDSFIEQDNQMSLNLTTPAIDISKNQSPEMIGRQIAETVYEGIVK